MFGEKEIGQILNKENLLFNKYIKKSGRFVLILTREEKNEKNVLLKILRDCRRSFSRKALEKEAAVLNHFNKIKNSYLKIPQFLGTGFLGRHFYLKEEFITGKILEEKNGFFFRKLSKREINEIIGIIFFLRKITPIFLKKNIPHLSDFGPYYLSFALKFHQKQIKIFLDEEQRKKFQGLIKQAKKALSLDVCKTAVHGEVYPNNLIKSQKGGIFLLDWENIGIGSFSRDAASVYLRLKNETLRSYFLKNLPFSNEKFFPLLFQVEIILQSLGSLDYFESAGRKNISYFQGAIKKFLK